MKKKYTTEQFVEKAISRNGTLYDYSKSEYFGKNIKVEIICPVHGSFWVSPDNHIHRKSGCPRCSKNLKLTKEEFINRSSVVHMNKYDYSKVDFKNIHIKVEIICPVHGSFWQRPVCHMKRRHDCPLCGNSTFSKAETNWLNSLDNTTNITRQYRIDLPTGNFIKVDGYDPKTNTIYEYYGVYWHGHPSYIDPDKNHPFGDTYGDRYLDTLIREIRLKEMGYNIITKWENE